MRLGPIVLLVWGATLLPAQPKPEWTDGSSLRYPQGLYLIGVGVADNREAAENQARANIGKIFRVDLRVQMQTVQQEVLRSREGRVDAESQERTRATVDVGLTKTLEGTQIAETWQDPADGKVYALAVLDRDESATIIRNRIRELDEEIEVLRQNAEEAAGQQDKFLQVRLMVRRKSLMRSRSELHSDLRIIDLSGEGTPAPYSLEKETAAIEAFLKDNLFIGVEGTGEGVETLVQLFTDELTRRGLTVRPVTDSNRAALDVIVVVSLKLDAATTPADDWYYCRWELSVNAADGEGGVLASDSHRGRSGQLTVASSKSRAVFDAKKKLGPIAEKVYANLLGK